MNRFYIYLIISFSFISVCAISQTDKPKDAFYYNKLLGRAVNMGNGLDAPKEGAWGVTLKDEYFEIIRKAGFNAVRLPVRWSAHAETEPPYTIDGKFFDRVDHLVKKATESGLVVVLNIHHYEEVVKAPEANRDRFTALWKQIAERYKSYPDKLYFELLNEPNDKLTAELWNTLLADTLKVVRKTNPQRIVVLGPAQWNNISKLDKLVLPADDRNIIVTYHFYDPFHFTHQGAEWAGPESRKWLGTRWTETDEEKKRITGAMDKAANWGRKENRPVFMGEFGAYSKAPMEDRARWTRFVAREAEKRGISWAYWEFCSGFGAYDSQANKWRPDLLSSLIPE